MQRSPQIVRMILMVVIGILLGMASAPRLEATQPIQSEFINVSQSEVTTPPLNGRGTGIREGQIRIEQYAFGRMDVLECLKPLQHIELALKPNSAPLNLVLKAGNKRFVIELSAQNWRLENQGTAKPYEKPWDSKWVTQDEISECRIAPQNGKGLLSTLRINDLELVQPSPHWEAGLIGGIFGLLFGWSQKRLSAYVILLATAIGWNSVSDWTTLAEQLALTQTPGWTLAQITLWILLWPWFTCLLVRPLKVDSTEQMKLWWAGGVLSCALATWQTPTMWAILGVAVALGPGLLHPSNPLRGPWLNADWPAWLFLSILGWKWGTLAAVSWRLTRIIVLRQALLKEDPKFAADHLAMALLSLVLATEVGLRSGYLNQAWSPENLAGEANEADNWRDPQPFWSGQCQKENQDEQRLVYLGGSSTGGAYQFGTEPDAFFATKIHERLCKTQSIHTWNYGAAERDSHTISRTLEQILTATKANWVILYIGHNDLTADNPYTRREREQRTNSLLAKVGKKARRLRMIAGSDLIMRSIKSEKSAPHIAAPPLGPDGKPMRSQVMHQGYPMAVPIQDARLNLIQIQSIASAYNAQVVLVPQLISKQSFNDLTEYWSLEKELAAQFSNVHLIDVRQDLRKKNEQVLLEDNNHFSRQGHLELARLLEPQLKQLFSSEYD